MSGFGDRGRMLLGLPRVAQSVDEFRGAHPGRWAFHAVRADISQFVLRVELEVGTPIVMRPPQRVFEWRAAPAGIAVGDWVDLTVAASSTHAVQISGAVIRIGASEIWIEGRT